ncbi:MAG: flagellar basal body P-ring formation protein FlgA [Opitutaceae bacterium]|nr:flagellar basal body P-ring formation protein FlgA [Verrucomicrobiales bacterium]
MNPIPAMIRSAFLLGALQCAIALSAFAEGPALRSLVATAQVDSEGVFVDQVLTAGAGDAWPHIRLAPAPAFGQTLTLSRAQIQDLLQKHAPDLAFTNWTGPALVRVARRTRSLDETEFKALLTAKLQSETVKDKGELELRFSRPWITIVVPDEPLTLRILDLPATGVGANFYIRLELLAGDELVGKSQLALQARVWREVPVAQAPLKRGQALRDAEVALERRDVLLVREALAAAAVTDGSLDLTENIQTGQPLLTRSVRVRPVVLRGRMVDGVVQDGAMSISLKVEALEDGLPGQTVRVRNPKTKREFSGKVQNEQTILISL